MELQQELPEMDFLSDIFLTKMPFGAFSHDILPNFAKTGNLNHLTVE